LTIVVRPIAKQHQERLSGAFAYPDTVAMSSCAYHRDVILSGAKDLNCKVR
jgi:hypothetical protein